MPEQIIADQVETQGTPIEQANVNIDEITKQIQANLEAKYKNEISGLNRKIGESEKQLKARLTEEEQIKMQAEAKTKEGIAKYTKLAIKEIGLNDEFSDLISGNDYDEIDQKIQTFSKIKESLTKDYEKRIKALEEELTIYKANGEAPKGGAQTVGTTKQRLIDQYNEAEKRGDAPLMLSLKERIRSLPKE